MRSRQSTRAARAARVTIAGERELKKDDGARRWAWLAFEVLPKNIPYENKTNKSRVSDVYVMGNEIGC